jgi:hypothetical protein
MALRCVAVVSALMTVVITQKRGELRLLKDNKAVLTNAEKTLVKEEQFLEKIHSQIAPKKLGNSRREEDLASSLKTFLKTFDESPLMVERGV